MADIHEPHSEREHRQLARAGIAVIIGMIACMALLGVIVLTHRAHTPELTPGQKQPSSLAFLDPRSG